MAATQELYSELIERLKKTALLGSCSAVLGWDEQVNLPPAGGEHRAEQLALLAGMTHEQATNLRLGEILSELEAATDLGDDTSTARINVKHARRSYDRATKLPQRLVEELSRVTTLAQQAWVEARKSSEYSAFRPWLTKVLGLKREEAEAIGYGDGQPYDAMLDEYEPGATAASIQAAFDPLRDELVPLVTAIRESGRQPDTTIITRSYPVDAQRQFGIDAATAIGFCFDSGRLDVAAHPFCSGFGPGDCRLTTRYDEHHFPGAFFGTLHEAGHGIYEQGLVKDAFGTAMGETVSLGIHESQSRMWENLVGRSPSFWQHFFPKAQAAFPEALSSVSRDAFHWAVNDVRPSFIRVEADEVTYNLHIMLRFELEQAMLTGDLQPAELPGVWNETFARYFGITPGNDSNGCLQDIHWSAGLLGYFPTYALGNMYAAQFFETADNELGGLHGQFAHGEFLPLKNWLNEKIHQPGKQYSAQDLVQHVTGKPLSHEPLMKHLKSRFGTLYGLDES
ncbi:MAG: carboxypeptidase M32 [Planctomycetota bacterium]|nr:carboxypeptidase M32 [Planctomycetota bacterium]